MGFMYMISWLHVSRQWCKHQAGMVQQSIERHFGSYLMKFLVWGLVEASVLLSVLQSCHLLVLGQAQRWEIGYYYFRVILPVALIKHDDQSNLKWVGFIFVHSLRYYAPCGETTTARPWESCWHCSHTQRTESNDCLLVSAQDTLST